MAGTVIFNVVFALAVAMLLCVAPAHAYLDPGSGSYLYYLLVSGFLGAGALVKFYWQRLKDFARRVTGGG